MISAYIRKSFTYLLPSNTFFLREFHVSVALSLHFRSTSTKLEGQPVAKPTVSEVLLGSTSERSKSILLFFKENGFSDTQLEIMMRARPELLSANLEKTIKPKFEIFQDWGFSVSEIADIVTKEPTVLWCSASNRVIPSLTALKGLLGSNAKMVKVLRKCGWFLKEDMDKRMWPNVEYLRSCGIPMEHVLSLVSKYATCLFLSPEVVKQCVEKLDRFGVDRSSMMYIHAFRIVCLRSNEVWELKLQAFRDLGFAETDILTAFKKAPQAFGVSVEKIKSMVEVILATNRYTISSIAASPMSLCCSIDKRIKPRLQVLEDLEKRNLIQKWPSLGVVHLYSEERFYERFIAPYPNEAGQVYTGKSVSISK